MNRFNRMQRRLIRVIVVILIIGSIMTGLRQNALSDLGYSAWTYIQYGLFENPIMSIGNAFNDVANLWHQHDDNQYLNEELAQQRSYKTLYEYEAIKNDELEKLLDVQSTQEDSKMVSTRVIKRSSSAWDQTVTIGAGSSQGVEVNMLVMSSEGAVGQVVDVQTNTSTVQLLTGEDLQNNLAVRLSLEDGTSVEGIISSFDSNRGAYLMSLYNNENSITSGQSVATSGIGGNYPSGILVGTVSEVVTTDDSIVPQIYVKPVSDISSFTYCIVIGSGEV